MLMLSLEKVSVFLRSVCVFVVVVVVIISSLGRLFTAKVLSCAENSGLPALSV